MNYPLLDVFLSILYFFLWILWIWLVVWILMDIFRSDDLNGWAKAAWTIFVIIIPLLGVLTYLIVRGHSMQDRQARQAKAQDEAFRAYVRDAAGTGATGTNGQSQSEELAKLANLRQRGVINEEEFEQAKAKVLS
jgi:hypothetical protein